MHDPRLGRFFAVDKLKAKYPYNSPYAFSENRVIDGIELEGLEYVFYHVYYYNTLGQCSIEKTGEKDYGNWLLNLTGGFNNAWDYPVHAVQSPIDGRHYLFATEDEAFLANMEDFNPKERLTYEGIQSLYMVTDALGGFGMGRLARSKALPEVVVRPSTTRGGQNVDDFISPHAYNRHKFDPSRTSSKSKTQYGEGVDVADIRNKTMNNADEIVPHYDKNGVNYATTYKKTFDGQNISTSDTPTSESRVIINHLDESKSSQFPYYKK